MIQLIKDLACGGNSVQVGHGSVVGQGLEIGASFPVGNASDVAQIRWKGVHIIGKPCFQTPIRFALCKYLINSAWKDIENSHQSGSLKMRTDCMELVSL